MGSFVILRTLFLPSFSAYAIPSTFSNSTRVLRSLFSCSCQDEFSLIFLIEVGPLDFSRSCRNRVFGFRTTCSSHRRRRSELPPSGVVQPRSGLRPEPPRRPACSRPEGRSPSRAQSSAATSRWPLLPLWVLAWLPHPKLSLVSFETSLMWFSI